MAMGSTGGGEGLSSEINVTPLIDVLLVLLIIFMITQPMSRKAFDVQVPPKQQTKSKTPPQAQIVLELRPDGSYAINGQHDLRSEEHTSELQSRSDLVCRLLLEKKKKHYPDLPCYYLVSSPVCPSSVMC